MIHQGAIFANAGRLADANPLLLDDVAIAFPELRIVIAHMGHPWVHEAVVVMAAATGTSTPTPRRLPAGRRCWPPALSAAKEYGVLDKVMFGSDSPMVLGRQRRSRAGSRRGPTCSGSPSRLSPMRSCRPSCTGRHSRLLGIPAVAGNRSPHLPPAKEQSRDRASPDDAGPPFSTPRRLLRGPLPEEVSMEPILAGVAVRPTKRRSSTAPTASSRSGLAAPGCSLASRTSGGSFMYIISGDATIVDEDGTSHELTAGCVLVLPFGWAGTWHIRETIRKVYLHTTPAPPLPSSVGRVPPFRPADPGTGRRAAGCEQPPPVHPSPPTHRGLRRSRRPLRYQVGASPASTPRARGDHGFFAFVLAGDGFLVDHDGTRHELTPGSVMALPSRWSGTWDIRHAFRAFCVRSTPRAAGLTQQKDWSARSRFRVHI